MNKFKTYELKRSITTLDSFGVQKKNNYEKVNDVRVAVFLKADNQLNNHPLFSKISHVGVYKGSFADFQKHDMLGNHFKIVTEPICGNRKILLYLEEV